MKQASVIIFLTLASCLLLTQRSFATTIYNKVSVTAQSSGGSDAEASVNENINASSTNNQSSSKCNRNVHIEANGEVQDYNSSNCDDINMQSKNGNVQVNIATNSSITPSITPSLEEENKQIQEKVDAANKKAEDRKELQDGNKSLIQRIQDAIKNFFDKFFKHF